MKRLCLILMIVCLLKVDAISKVILMPVQEGNAFGVENIYVSPQTDKPALIAFYGEDGKHIFIFNAKERKCSKFTFKVSDSLLHQPSVSFISFCWDIERYGHFTVIFSQYGQKTIFTSNIHSGGALKKRADVSVKTVAFNYVDGVVSYVNLENGEVEKIPGGIFSRSLEPPDANQVITQYKIIQNSGEPYFTLRDMRRNDNGIYRGSGFKKVVDEPAVDELYPHYSASGNMLGYIERERGSGIARVCLKTGDQVKRSHFTFALEENALLREYNRMFFVGKNLYYFVKTPDLNSKSKRYGLFVFPGQGNERVLTCHSRLISKGEPVMDIFSNKQGQCIRVETFPFVKNILPFWHDGRIHYAFLSNQGLYKIAIQKQTNRYSFPKVKSQAIVITGEWPCQSR